MNAERETSRIFDAYEQTYQQLWNSWAEITVGWNETAGRSMEVWQEAFRKAMDAQFAMLQQTAVPEEDTKRAESGEQKVA